jgi:hypothetical protein
MPTANVLTYAELFQNALDQQMIAESASAWMEANASMVRYNGGNKVKIPKILMEGLGDYSRSAGFDDGAVTLDWEEFTFSMDRGKEFNLDTMDYDETNFVAGAGLIMSEFQRTKVVPEVDAYRYSKIFSLANAGLKTRAYTPVVGTVFAELKADIKAIQDIIGENEPLAIAISFDASDTLDNATDVDKTIGLIDFSNGAISTKTKSIDGIPMFRVPSARFKSAYAFSSTNGFSAAATAMKLNWVIAARRAIIAIVKTEKVRVFEPGVNQQMDAWKIQYRKYHDLWIPTNKLDAIYVNYTSIAAPALTATVAAGVATGSTKFTATPGAGNTLAYLLQAGEITDPKFNDIPTGLTAYTSGADIAVVATNHLGMYELDAAGHVVKFAEHTIVSGDIK